MNPKHLHNKNGWYYYVKTVNDKVKWIALGTKDRNEALRLWAELEADPARVITKKVKNLRMTFGVLTDAFLDYVKENNSSSTYKTYTRVIDRLKSDFGELLVQDIDRSMLNRYHAVMVSTPYEANLHVRVMSAIMQYAVEQGIIIFNPASKIKKYPEERHNLKLTVDILFQKIFPNSEIALQKAIMFAFHLVQHENEVKNLKWSDIDIIKKKISFVRQKTGKPITINFSENPAFSKFISQIHTERQDLYPNIIHHNGTPYRSFRHLWQKALKKAGYEHGQFVFKEIRHLANTILKDANIDPYKRMQMTGHSSIAVNERYTHPSGKETVEAGIVLGKIGKV